MSKKLIISARTWSTFVESLKGNLKHNFGICEKTLFKNGYYTAVLQQGTDRAYIARLNSVTGEETENVLDLCDFLGSCLVPFPQELMTRMKEIVGKAEDNKQKEAVATTIKRVPRKAKEKK